MSTEWSGPDDPRPMGACVWVLAGSVTVWLLAGLALWWWLR